jgi:hypothetical protein
MHIYKLTLQHCIKQKQKNIHHKNNFDSNYKSLNDINKH